MLTLDKNTILDFTKRGVKKIKVFFYAAGCSGTKIDIIEDDFEVDGNLVCIYFPQGGEEKYLFDVYVEKSDFEKLENATITRIVKADHTGNEETRYIYSSEDVLDRCGCGTSFSFEKKKPKINLEKLKTLKIDINK